MRIDNMLALVKDTARDVPGVYRMTSADGEVIYVGKSKALRTRLCCWRIGPSRSIWAKKLAEVVMKDPVFTAKIAADLPARRITALRSCDCDWYRCRCRPQS